MEKNAKFVLLMENRITGRATNPDKIFREIYRGFALKIRQKSESEI